MKKYKKSFFIFILIGFMLFACLPTVKGFDDIEYTFERDILYNESEPELEFFNMREQQVYNGTYNATFSFNNELGLESTDISFVSVDSSTEGSSVSVVESFLEHKNVLDCNDIDDSSRVIIKNLHTPQSINPSVEFWFASTNIDNTHFFNWNNELDQNAVWLRIESGILAYFDGSTHNIANLDSNIWYHLRLDLDLVSDNYDIYLNGILIQNDAGFRFVSTLVDDFSIATLDASSNYHLYIDGFGYSFEGLENSGVSYDFNENEINDNPEGWNTIEGTKCFSNISTILDSRVKPLAMFDGDVLAQFTQVSQVFPSSNIQSLQFDMTYNILGSTNTTIFFMEDSTIILEVEFSNNDATSLDGLGGGDVIKNNFLTANLFSVFKFVFDHDNNQFDCYIDDILEGDDLGYQNNIIVEIDSIIIKTSDDSGGGQFNWIFFIDNIHFNRVDYEIGGNIMPSLEVLEGFEGLLETDKYEFSLIDVNERAELGAASFPTWFFDDSGSGTTQIVQDCGIDDNLDRKIQMENGGGLGNNSIIRTNLPITNDLIDVKIGWQSIAGSDVGDFIISLNSSDGSLITSVLLKTTADIGVLSYWNGTNWIALLSGIIVFDINFEVNIAINYDIDIVRLTLLSEGIFVNNFVYLTVFSDKSGLKEIKIESNTEGGSVPKEIEIDYVGIYKDGISHTTEVGLIITPIGKGYHFERHYLYSILGKGRFHEGVIEGSYTVEETPFLNIKNVSSIGVEKEGVLKTFNIYDSFILNISNATLVFTCINSDISISDITIEGSKLTEGSNEHFLIFSSGGLESIDNYFFVDSSNNLRFTHNTSLNDVNEFIQAEFDIDDKTSTDTAVAFRSDIDSNAFGFFRINYDTTSQIIPIENILKSKRVLLNTDLTINSFIILVSDTNKNGISGLTEGLVSNIVLLDITTAIVSIVSLNIVEMIIPLIIILIPTLAISGLYGKFLVAPLFMLFTIIVGITSIIPVWLLFVIIISNIMNIFFDNSKKGVS